MFSLVIFKCFGDIMAKEMSVKKMMREVERAAKFSANGNGNEAIKLIEEVKASILDNGPSLNTTLRNIQNTHVKTCVESLNELLSRLKAGKVLSKKREWSEFCSFIIISY